MQNFAGQLTLLRFKYIQISLKSASILLFPEKIQLAPKKIRRRISTSKLKMQQTIRNLTGMMSCNDQFQEMYAAILGDPMTNGPQLPTRILASLSAGFTAALFSMPFDLIKSRLMAQKPDPITGEMPYKGVMDCITKMIRTEGPMGFYNGFSAYYGRCAPHAMIVLLSKDSITKAYRNAFE